MSGGLGKGVSGRPVGSADLEGKREAPEDLSGRPGEAPRTGSSMPRRPVNSSPPSTRGARTCPRKASATSSPSAAAPAAGHDVAAAAQRCGEHGPGARGATPSPPRRSGGPGRDVPGPSIFGAHKTIRGLVAGTVVGAATSRRPSLVPSTRPSRASPASPGADGGRPSGGAPGNKGLQEATKSWRQP